LRWHSNGIVEIAGSYLAHVWLENGNFFFPLGLAFINFVLCTLVINTYATSPGRAVVLYASAFLLMIAAWVFVLDGQVLGGVDLAVSLVLVVSTSVLAYWTRV
jgi:drug/metabolite transporter superfamily protein YnfA